MERGLAEFIAEIIADPVLVAHLVSIEDRREFQAEVSRCSNAAGYPVTAEQIEDAMAANRKRWIERSLPW